ncbi:hypothetical protein [Marinomonas transparens]|uniref:Uncharacterized protein n=1 Tax=Marinomonas transparens TaxID=2795388 RepID=A0A934JSM8_9GAMM|nr:hypothetical protein [Marinomonas transparens]MBJ7539264.1 hypothetical protein [Marinomonas transparens]
MLTPEYIKKNGSNDYHEGVSFYGCPDPYKDFLVIFWREGWLMAQRESLRSQLIQNEFLLKANADAEAKLKESKEWQL